MPRDGMVPPVYTSLNPPVVGKVQISELLQFIDGQWQSSLQSIVAQIQPSHCPPVPTVIIWQSTRKQVAANGKHLQVLALQQVTDVAAYLVTSQADDSQLVMADVRRQRPIERVVLHG